MCITCALLAVECLLAIGSGLVVVRGIRRGWSVCVSSWLYEGLYGTGFDASLLSRVHASTEIGVCLVRYSWLFVFRSSFSGLLTAIRYPGLKVSRNGRWVLSGSVLRYCFLLQVLCVGLCLSLYSGVLVSGLSCMGSDGAVLLRVAGVRLHRLRIQVPHVLLVFVLHGFPTLVLQVSVSCR